MPGVRALLSSLLSPQIKLSVHFARNLLRSGGAERNRILRKEWAWQVARMQAARQGRDVVSTLVEGTSRLTFHSHPQDGAVGKSVFLGGKWESLETNLLRRLVKPGMVVLDVGANIGAHTLTLAAIVGAQGKVYSFEPSAAFDYLQTNVTSNHLDQVTLNRVAVGDHAGTLRLSKTPAGSEAFTTISQRSVNQGSITGETFEVPMITLDDFFAQNNLTQVDLLKMDIEGAEVLALRGARRVLASGQVKAWLVEFNAVNLEGAGFTVSGLANLFIDAGYRLFCIEDDGMLTAFDVTRNKNNRDNLAILPQMLDPIATLIR